MSHQTYIPGTRDGTQCEMLAEFSDKLGKKGKLIDVDEEKARLAAKPLPGQLEMEVNEDGK